MRHDEYAGLQDVYYFDLSQGSVMLTVDHRPSPMGGHTIRLALLSGDEGSGPLPSTLRPSDVGVAGFDGLWEDDAYPEVQRMSSGAYGVPDDAVARLVDALSRLEGVESP